MKSVYTCSKVSFLVSSFLNFKDAFLLYDWQKMVIVHLVSRWTNYTLYMICLYISTSHLSTRRNTFNSSLLQFFTKFTNFSPYVTSTQSTSTSTPLDLLYGKFLSTSQITNTVSLKIKFTCKGIEFQLQYTIFYYYHNSNSLFLKSDIP
jgi:hypothetical protein